MRFKRTDNFDQDLKTLQKSIDDFKLFLSNRKCNKCKKGITITSDLRDENWDVFELNCECDGRYE